MSEEEVQVEETPIKTCFDIIYQDYIVGITINEEEFKELLEKVDDVNQLYDYEKFENKKTRCSMLFYAIKSQCSVVKDILLSHPYIDPNVGMTQEPDRYDYTYAFESDDQCYVSNSPLTLASSQSGSGGLEETLVKFFSLDKLDLGASYRDMFCDAGCGGTWHTHQSLLSVLIDDNRYRFPSIYKLLIPILIKRPDFDPNFGDRCPSFPRIRCAWKNVESILNKIVRLQGFDESQKIEWILPLLDHPRCDPNIGFDDLYRRTEVYPVVQHAMELGYFKIARLLMMYGTDASKLSNFLGEGAGTDYIYQTRRNVIIPNDIKNFIMNYPCVFDVRSNQTNIKFFSKRFKDFAIFVLMCVSSESYKGGLCKDVVLVILSFVNEVWFGKDNKFIIRDVSKSENKNIQETENKK